MGALVFILGVIGLIILLAVVLERRNKSADELGYNGELVAAGKAPPLSRQEVLSYLACYGLYILLIAIIFVSGFVIWPGAIIALIGALLGSTRANAAIYQFSMSFLWLALLVIVLAAEPYMRGGIAKGKLLARFARVSIPLALFGALGWMLRRISIALMS